MSTATQAAAREPTMLWYLDSPQATVRWADADVIDLRGWVASSSPIDRVWIDEPQIDAAARLTYSERPDVTGKYGLHAIGFAATIDRRAAGERDVFELVFRAGGATASIVVPAVDRALDWHEAHHRKLRRLVPLLRCPLCRSGCSEVAVGFRCDRCGTDYAAGRSLDFLPVALRDEFMIEPTDNVSANAYDGTALNVINRHHGGLVLDCGAGRRDTYHANVVNLDVADYPSTDVLAVGERLPFADGSFDAVLSLACLEHVKCAHECAREIVRVLKPGGALYCQVPFLQPVHAYPNHFANLTSQGLAVLFDDLTVERLGTFPFGQPIFAVSWILDAYRAGLPEAIARRFDRMTVGELAALGDECLGADYVTALGDRARDTLASCNALLATKPAATPPACSAPPQPVSRGALRRAWRLQR